MPTLCPNTLATIADDIAARGYSIVTLPFSHSLLLALQQRAQTLGDEVLHTAGIGRGSAQQYNSAVRRDKTLWLSEENAIDARYLAWLNALRHGINERLFLGLFDVEAHYARYNQGDFYQKHVDALRGKSNRMLSSVLYLNDNWQTQSGGELVLYEADNTEHVLTHIMPTLGTLVLFLSEQFPHEVLPAQQVRHSIASWFRVRA